MDDKQNNKKYNITQNSVNCLKIITQEKTIDFVPIDKIKEWNKTFKHNHLIECIKLETNDGETHFVQKDLANKWLKEFKLTDINDDFIPNFEPKIKEILHKYGVNEIHLKIGSLIKVNNHHRERYVCRIKSTLESPNAIMEHKNSLLFIKDFNEEKFFTSVTKDENGEWIVKSNAPKGLNNLKGKVEKENGIFIYGSLEELESIKTHPNAFTPLVDFQKQQAQDRIIQQTKPKSQVNHSKTPKTQSNDFGMNM